MSQRDWLRSENSLPTLRSSARSRPAGATASDMLAQEVSTSPSAVGTLNSRNQRGEQADGTWQRKKRQCENPLYWALTRADEGDIFLKRNLLSQCLGSLSPSVNCTLENSTKCHKAICRNLAGRIAFNCENEPLNQN